MPLPPPTRSHVALVTGASSGIGEEIARDLAARGHDLVLVARSRDRLEALAASLPTTAHVVPADLSDAAERARLPAELDRQGLVVDVLVNNAGFSTLGPVSRSDPEAELRMVAVDVAAVVDLCSRFVPGMVERRRGAVLNVASTAAFQPLPGQAAYGGSKAFVLSYSRSLAEELRGSSVTATVLCPGPVDTGFGEAAGFDPDDFEKALPRPMWVPAREVARVAVAGLDAGRVVVIPGAVNRVGALLASRAPQGLLARVLAKAHPGLR